MKRVRIGFDQTLRDPSLPCIACYRFEFCVVWYKLKFASANLVYLQVYEWVVIEFVRVVMFVVGPRVFVAL